METHPQHSGLTSAQVAERVAAGETNDTGRRTSRPVSDIVRANVLTRFNAIVGALAAVVLVTGHPQDALFGLVIVANTGIGVIQELRAKRTLDRLAVLGEEPVRVMRDGAETALRPQDMVLDDRILIGPGDRVMVDGEVTDGPGMEVNESLLTGEIDPVTKKPGDQLLSGSFVVSGSGAFTATRVGRRSYAAQLEGEASVFSLAHSELMAGINRFLRLITWVIVPVAILLTASQLAYANGAFSDAVAGAVAGIITMIPEGLVLLTSVAFAVGVVRLGRRRCLVQELPAIEVLARVDVLCLDKTGTLTEPGMELDQVVEVAPGVPVRKVLASLVGAEERPNPTMQAIASGLVGLPAAGDSAGQGPADRGRPTGLRRTGLRRFPRTGCPRTGFPRRGLTGFPRRGSRGFPRTGCRRPGCPQAGHLRKGLPLSRLPRWPGAWPARRGGGRSTPCRSPRHASGAGRSSRTPARPAAAGSSGPPTCCCPPGIPPASRPKPRPRTACACWCSAGPTRPTSPRPAVPARTGRRWRRPRCWCCGSGCAPRRAAPWPTSPSRTSPSR